MIFESFGHAAFIITFGATTPPQKVLKVVALLRVADRLTAHIKWRALSHLDAITVERDFDSNQNAVEVFRKLSADLRALCEATTLSAHPS